MTIHRFAIEQTIDHSLIHEDQRSDIDQRHTALSLYDTESNDVKLARKMADEAINVSGAEVKLYIRTDNQDYDPVWDSDPDPTYWKPYYLKGFFKPSQLEAELNKWGVNVINKIEIVFSFRTIYMQFLERMIRTGDVVQIQYNSSGINPKSYRVVNATPTGNFRYTWLYFTCQCEILTADVTVRPEDDLKVINDDDTRGTYYESP